MLPRHTSLCPAYTDGGKRLEDQGDLRADQEKRIGKLSVPQPFQSLCHDMSHETLFLSPDSLFCSELTEALLVTLPIPCYFHPQLNFGFPASTPVPQGHVCIRLLDNLFLLPPLCNAFWCVNASATRSLSIPTSIQLGPAQLLELQTQVFLGFDVVVIKDPRGLHGSWLSRILPSRC